MRRKLSIFIGALCLLVAPRVQAQTTGETGPEANPGRPTVSTPATLTPVGYLQFENGLLYAEQSPEFSTRTGLNQVTKLAVSSRLQALLLIEPLVHSQTDGSNTENHVGEVFLGVQRVLLPGERRRPTISVSYIYRLYASPAPEIDMAFFAAADARERCGQPVGGFLSGAEEPCSRCRIQPWTHQHIDAMGGFRRVYLPAATSAVA